MISTTIDGKAIYSRDDFIRLLHSALECGSFRFLRQASMAWLSVYPGDLEIRLVYATGMIAEGKRDDGVEHLEGIVRMDPEFEDALQALFYSLPEQETDKRKTCNQNLFVLTGNKTVPGDYPAWCEGLRQSYILVENHDQNGLAAISDALSAINPDSVLAAIQQLRAAEALGNKAVTAQLADDLSMKWNECLHFQLWQAEAYFEKGEDAKAVALMHTCVSRDSTGQVARRIWGENHPYKPLWPTSFEIDLDIPLPADVASYMGLNILGAAGPVTDSAEYEVEDAKESNDTGFAEEEITFDNARVDEPPSGEEPLERIATWMRKKRKSRRSSSCRTDENVEKEQKTDEVIKVAAELETLSRKLRKPSSPRTDGRFPLYVIFTVHGNLKKQYGAATTEVIEKETAKIAAQFQKRAGWGAMRFHPG